MKKQIILMSALLCLSVGAIAATATVGANAASLKESVNDFQELSLGSYLSVPSKTLSYEGESKEATIYVSSPTGISYKTNYLKMNEVGYWHVKYSAVIKGKIVEEPHQFYVYKPTYYTAKSQINVRTNSYFKYCEEGLDIRLAKGDTFEYGESINLEDLGTNSIIGLGLSPMSDGTPEVATVNVRLTDSYDDTNYIEYIFVNPNSKNPGTYAGFGCVNGTFSGADVTMGLESIKSGPIERWLINSGYGAYTTFSFEGSFDRTTKTTASVYKNGVDPITNLSYDVSKKHMLTENKLWPGTTDARYSDYARLIADVGRDTFVNDSISQVQIVTKGPRPWSTAFKGFTTNDVKLSVYATGYTGSDCGIFIKSIAGADFNQLKTYDSLNPILNVDILGYDAENLPIAKVNSPYKLFDATVSDDFTKNIDIKTNVYRSLNGYKLNSIPVNNGCFTPTEEGTYLLEYVATDGSSRKAVKTFEIQAVYNVEKPEIDLKGSVLSEYNCGEVVDIPEAEVTSFSGDSNLDVKAYFGDEEIEINKNQLSIAKEGDYKIVYTATDYLGQTATKTLNFRAIAPNKPVLISEPSCNPAYVVGYSYKVDSAYAYDFKSVDSKGNAEILKSSNKVYVGTEEVAVNDGYFKVPETDSDKLTFKYTFYGTSGTTVVKKEVPIVEIENKNIKNEDALQFYVTDDGVEKFGSSDFISFKFTQDKSFTYINKLPDQGGSYTFTINSDSYEKAEKINFTFTDTKDSNKQVRLTFESKGKNQSSCLMYVNNGDPTTVDSTFSEGNARFEFILDAANNAFKYDLISAEFDTYLNGLPFEGFSEECVYLTVSVEGVQTNKPFTLNVLTIADQRMMVRTKAIDYSSPIVIVEGENKHRYGMGEVINTFVCYAYDVFQANSIIELSIVDYDNKPITLLNGQTATGLDASKTYSFKLDKYGSYYAVYNVDDGLGNNIIKRVPYIVEDDVDPEISGTFRSCNVSLNQEVTFDKVTFSDNVTSSDKLGYTCYVVNPAGKIFVVEKGSGDSVILKYTFSSTGKWIVYWSATDEAGNSSYASMNVYVK